MNSKKSNTDKKSQSDTSAVKAETKIRGLEHEADKERTRKPGSQSNSSDRHNTGRGGGK
ncbi:hypothetical protein [Sediminibacterium ginsengisoli]|uniref:Uncharacterized protein n=1 Tax=Sediminibacterium ginsengisoli TaxID=413434 RepID=A0A1T4LAZ3_9BACT|nr:hypothetical protein [Sediminibacterium ginsengisoli]SJZ51905.1 hypothetical protein SAMN04488132_102407 [Sediminibacterium ginsengisoli]